MKEANTHIWEHTWKPKEVIPLGLLSFCMHISNSQDKYWKHIVVDLFCQKTGICLINNRYLL